MKENINKLFHQHMTRSDFLRTLGLILLSVVGFAGIVSYFRGDPHYTVTRVSSNNGSDVLATTGASVPRKFGT